MTTLEGLRTNLFATAKAACLVEAREISVKWPGSSLPSEAAIEDFARWISTSAGPVANAHLTLNSGAFAPGGSRLVGMPDMPANMEWPNHNGRPLAFLAQIDLASLPSGVDWPAPRKGWLYFFLGAVDGDKYTSIEVGNVDSSPNRTLYFGGSISELRPRPSPEGTIAPYEFSKAVPYSVSFELGLSAPSGLADLWPFGLRGNGDLPWERNPDLRSFDRLQMLDYGPVMRECKDRMFGLPRHTQTQDSQFMAAATMAGFGSVMHLDGMSPEQFERFYLPLRREWTSPEFVKLFKEMKARQSWLEDEARHWCSLFSLGSHRHGNTGRGGGSWHFCWDDVQTYHVSVDQRRTRSGDFSQTFIHISAD